MGAWINSPPLPVEICAFCTLPFFFFFIEIAVFRQCFEYHVGEGKTHDTVSSDCCSGLSCLLLRNELEYLISFLYVESINFQCIYEYFSFFNISSAPFYLWERLGQGLKRNIELGSEKAILPLSFCACHKGLDKLHFKVSEPLRLKSVWV